MIENPNFVERVFFGQAHPISYFFAGFIGSPIIGLLVIKVFRFIGAYAEKSDQFMPPIITMGIGTLGCIGIGWTYTAWISYGIWKYYQKASHWIRYVLLVLGAIHLILVCLMTLTFVDFSIFSTKWLLEDGRFLLNI